MSKISIPSPKVSDPSKSNTSEAKKKSHQVKTAPAAKSKKVPVVASAANPSTPIQKRAPKVNKSAQPAVQQQAKQQKGASPKQPVKPNPTAVAAPKAPNVPKVSVLDQAKQPVQVKNVKPKQPKKPAVQQQAKQQKAGSPKQPVKPTLAPVVVPKAPNVPKVSAPDQAKQPVQVKDVKPKQPKKPAVQQQAKQQKAGSPKQPVKPNPTAVAAPKAPNVPKVSAPDQAKQPVQVKNVKPKQPKKLAVQQQAKQQKAGSPKQPVKPTLAPVVVPQIIDTPKKNMLLEGKDHLDLGFMPLDELQSKLEKLIEEILADPSHENFTLYFSYKKTDWEALFNWFKPYEDYPYPCSVHLKWDQRERPLIERQADLAYRNITLTNYTNREQVVRTFVSRFFGGKLDEKLINPKTFYNLLARTGLLPEHFDPGVHGFTDKVYCKSVQLENNESVEAAQSEFRRKIDEELVNVRSKTSQSDVNYKYVVLVFQWPKRSDLPFYKINLLSPGSMDFHISNLCMGQLYENSERRIYICFRNDARLVLDLHEHSRDEALDKVEDFVLTKWERYEDSCEIITGAGNHSARGFSILKKEIPKFLKSPEMSPYVQKVKQLGDYKFQVFLRQAKLHDLTQLAPGQDPVKVAIAAIKKAILADEPRVRFLANNVNAVWPRVMANGFCLPNGFSLPMSITFHGENEFRIEIQEPFEEGESSEEVQE